MTVLIVVIGAFIPMAWSRLVIVLPIIPTLASLLDAVGHAV